MTEPKDHSDIKTMSFEQALKELETIVDRLEKGDVELEASILIYERGEALKTYCDALLRKAEARVEKISLNQNGQPTGTEPLDVENSALSGKKPAAWARPGDTIRPRA